MVSQHCEYTLNATELCTLRQIILHFVNFVSIEKSKREPPLKADRFMCEKCHRTFQFDSSIRDTLERTWHYRGMGSDHTGVETG